MKIPATVNGMKQEKYDSFLEVSGGFGNHSTDEIHLMMYDNSRQQFAQAWFKISDLLNEVEKEREDD